MEVRGYEMLGEGGIKWFRMVCQSFNYSTFIHVCIHNWQIPFKLEVFGLKPTVGCLRFENVQNIARVIVLLIMIHAQFLRNAPPSPENSNSFASWIKSKKEASPPPPPHTLWKQYYTHFLFGIWSWIELHATVLFGNGKCWLNNHRTN